MKRRIFRYAVLVCAVLLLLISAWQLYSYWHESSVNRQFTLALAQRAVTIADPQRALSSAPGGVAVQESPISVDFSALAEESADAVAWLYCPDTPINYPVAHSADNEDYLHHLLDGTYNAGGTLFVDCRNSGDFSDLNTVIYGHNMKNKSMFGSLSGYKKQDYYDKHPVIYLSTPQGDYKLLLVAGCVTDSPQSICSIPQDTAERDALLDIVISASTFVSDVVIAPDDRLVTLATCTYEYDDARYVLVCVLRELS